MNSISDKEHEFEKNLVMLYLKHGSVEKALREKHFSLPVSYATYQRILDKWGVIKVAGPHSKLNEAVDFFTELIDEEIPLEALYQKMPHSFQTSAKTLYRILGYIKEGVTRRTGTALVITAHNDINKVLIAKDISAPRINVGKAYGAHTLPMGFSRRRDTARVNVKRVLQQEVFTKKLIEGEFPEDVLENIERPFMYIEIVDVRVAVYHIELPKNLSEMKCFKSFKLKEYEYFDINKNSSRNFRLGVKEIMKSYKKYLRLLEKNLVVNPLQTQSLLNRKLEVALEVEQ